MADTVSNSKKTEYRNYSFNNKGINKIKNNPDGQNWPVVYILSGKDNAYVGETNNAYHRMTQHLNDPQRKVMDNILLLLNRSFNKSATLDIENQLIQFMLADEKFKLQNANGGQSVRNNYYQRSMYQQLFQDIWNALRERNLANKTLYEIKNSEIFKYSPYKQLTQDQFTCVEALLKMTGDAIEQNTSKNLVIQGGAGTGKTVLAIYFIKCLVDLLNQNTNFDDLDEVLPEDSQILHSAKLIEAIQKKGHLEIGYVVPASAFRGTVSRVFTVTKHGLRGSMVIGPNDIAKKHYDVLIVDEAHRLKRRNRLNSPSMYKNFDAVSSKLGLPKDCSQVDWVMADERLLTVMFYDPNQQVNTVDALDDSFDKFMKHSEIVTLKSQLRIAEGEDYGDDYIEFINDLMLNKPVSFKKSKYKLKVFDDYGKMEKAILEQNTKMNGLCRILSGLAFEYGSTIRSKNLKETKTTIEINSNGNKYLRSWNIGFSSSKFVTDDTHVGEIGCVYTAQGYDLNYAGVILGPDIYYDVKTKRIEIDVGKHSSRDMIYTKGEDISVAKQHIINQYLILLTRGVFGTYIYAVDDNLRDYLKRVINGK